MPPIREWSHYQTAIYAAVRDTPDSLLIAACAGSGKTTTLLEAIGHVPMGQRVVMLAFNKVIQQTLEQRVRRPGAVCLTLHAAGFRAWRQVAAGARVDSGKTSAIMKELMTWPQQKAAGEVRRVVSLAKQAGIVPDGDMRLLGLYVPSDGYGRARRQQSVTNGHPVSLSELPDGLGEPLVASGLLPDESDTWAELLERYDIGQDEVDLSVVRQVLREGLRRSDEIVDFDDMCYLSVVTPAPFDKYDVVCVDELQDLSHIQHVMVRRMLAPEGRVIGAGDTNQAVYSFRGALSNSMERFAETFQCRRLPLSISYRCPQAVVRHVQQWVKAIEPAPDAPEGLVEQCKTWRLSDFLQSDVVLCRLNRPLVALAFQLIGKRIPCRVLGRDIGQGLVSLVKKSKLQPQDAAGRLADWLVAYESRESARLREKREYSKIGLLSDKCATLLLFIEHEATVADVTAAIEALFSDNNGGRLTLSSIHKMKGGEAPRVFVLDADLYQPVPWATNAQEEENLSYVAATRAQRELRYIRTEDLK